MEVQNTLFVNLISGPGAGKSTTAAKVFAMLKDEGISCELIREWVKDAVWEENQCVLTDELKIFAEQNHLQHRLNGKVSVVVTDSPLIMKLYYQPKEFDMTDLVLRVANQYNNLNIFLDRKKKYVTAGRIQTEIEAKEIDTALRHLLVKHHILYDTAEGTTDGAKEIVRGIKIVLATKQMLERNKLYGQSEEVFKRNF
jgi:thymidylate kinase